MGNLTEDKNPSAFVEDLTQIETPDPVLGGDNGPPNIPNRELGQRTWWLKNAYDLLSGLFSAHANSSDNPHQVNKDDVGLSDIPNAVSNSVSLDSPNSLGTSRAIKLAYDKAVEALNAATAAATAAAGSITEATANTLFVKRSEVSGSVTSTSTTNVGSSLAVKTAFDKAQEALNAALNSLNVTAGDLRWVAKNDVQDSVTDDSQTKVASSRAAKTANDKALEALDVANGKITLATADGRYIRLSSISSSVSSSSTSDVANSAAVKAAYEKAIAATFPSGTRLLFVQSFAPVGWTKVTTHNNKALRIVSGNGGGSGGSRSFTDALKSQTISGNTGYTAAGGSVTVNNHTLSEAQMPHHAHGYGTNTVNAQNVPGSVHSAGHSTFFNTSGKGGTQGHNHTASFRGSTHRHTFSTTLNMSVQYVDAIICQKD